MIHCQVQSQQITSQSVLKWHIICFGDTRALLKVLSRLLPACLTIMQFLQPWRGFETRRASHPWQLNYPTSTHACEQHQCAVRDSTRAQANDDSEFIVSWKNVSDLSVHRYPVPLTVSVLREERLYRHVQRFDLLVKPWSECFSIATERPLLR